MTTDNTLIKKISNLEDKLDFVVSALQRKRDTSKYLTAQDIEAEYGIDQRTVLNRSNLHPSSPGFIPSMKISGKGRRKYFERKVIDRLLKPVSRR
ncbi:hypothetical protein [Rhodohalobacter barkolensis]|uniref:DNA-binding protein n=1 Tax=Rhodohalobacter barkolensis TaxID=2053187 RepID=A0A2N0VHM0_9BACT|nr:hypothetical protein [Rhodohalobacter barkolensis]PKD43692.1 hypothetical protein CWD77_09025 [Rhodohalobacter barkolensis]